MLVRPSFVLGGRGMEIVYDTPALRDYFERIAGEVIIEEGKPLLVDRFLDDAIEIDVDALYDGDGALHRRRHGAPRGGRDPLRRLELHPAAGLARPHRHRPGAHGDPGDRRGRRRAGPAERAVRDQRRRALRASRRTRGRAARSRSCRRRSGIPLAKAASRIMAGSTIAQLKTEGMLPQERRLAGAARLAGLGEGGGAAVQAVPHQGRPDRRLHPRAGDALDRRGHGHRPRLPDRVREEPGRRLRRHADVRHRVRLGRRRRQARRDPAGAPAAPARLHDRRDRGHGRDALPQRHPGDASCEKYSDTQQSRVRRTSST